MDERNGASAPSVQFLLGGIVSDVRQLLRQEVMLARCELYEEWRKLRIVLCAVAAGVVFLAGSVLPLAFAFVYLLVRFGLDEWAAFGLVGGLLFLLGISALGLAAYKAIQIRVVPPQTAETLKENVEWLRKQM